MGHSHGFRTYPRSSISTKHVIAAGVQSTSRQATLFCGDGKINNVSLNQLINSSPPLLSLLAKKFIQTCSVGDILFSLGSD